jgi:hypothetical protein
MQARWLRGRNAAILHLRLRMTDGKDAVSDSDGDHMSDVQMGGLLDT